MRALSNTKISLECIHEAGLQQDSVKVLEKNASDSAKLKTLWETSSTGKQNNETNKQNK